MKKSKSGVPFRIVAGHHGGTVSKIREHRVGSSRRAGYGTDRVIMSQTSTRQGNTWSQQQVIVDGQGTLPRSCWYMRGRLSHHDHCI